MEEKNFKRTTVTAALPYANGGVHIGHLAGVYVPADIYVRYLRLKKKEVMFIGGSDEHGVPVTIRARKEGITVQEVVDRYHNLIKKSFEDFGISFDVYSRTTSKIHHKFASDFFRTLYDKGELVEKTEEQFCDAVQRELTATSARSVEPHFLPRSLSTPPTRTIPATASLRRPRRTGTCRSTSGRTGSSSGFSKTTRSGVPTYTDSASHGSTWISSPAP